MPSEFPRYYVARIFCLFVWLSRMHFSSGKIDIMVLSVFAAVCFIRKHMKAMTILGDTIITPHENVWKPDN
jgi:hypothetical protein